MIYKLREPSESLKPYIKSFWLIDGEGDTCIIKQKIIPDGYPELIFHYKDKFKVNISGQWNLQDTSLVAGQIKNHFYLENTGQTGIVGIKLQPCTLKLLFDFDMSLVTNKVISIKETKLNVLQALADIIKQKSTFLEAVNAIENWFIELIKNTSINNSKTQLASQLILEAKGGIKVNEIIDILNISERSLERYFKSYIGLTPKFYCRVIRFSNIFNLIQSEDFNWSDITYLAGFYDQSHFIKNFKEFTGEEPSTYGFDEKNLANFFLIK